MIFTTLLLLITLLNPDAFDYDLAPPWVWTMSYVIYPILGVVLAWCTRGPAGATGVPVARWARSFLQVQAAVFGVAGVALLTAPGVMVDLWPWPIDKGLAQFYGGPFLAARTAAGPTRDAPAGPRCSRSCRASSRTLSRP